MVSVLDNHFPYVFIRLVFPFFTADMLPSRKLRKNQKSDFITAVDEVVTLRIMRCPDLVKSKLVFQNVGIVALHVFRHGIPHVGIALVTVQPADFDFFVVKVKSRGIKTYVAETEACLNPVNLVSVFIDKHSGQKIERRIFKSPHPYSTCKRGSKNGISRNPGIDFEARSIFVCTHRNRRIDRRNDALPDCEPLFSVQSRNFYRRAELIFFGRNKNVFYISWIFYFKKNFTVDSAVSHVVDSVSERRNVLHFVSVLAAVNDNVKNIGLSFRQKIFGKVKSERRVSAPVVAKEFSVQINF